MLRVKDEKELAKCGLVIDPSDPTMAVPIGQQTPTSTNGLPGNGNGSAHAGSEPSAKTETAQAAANVADSPIVVPSHSAPANGNGAHDTASFTRETLVGPVGDLSNLDDQAITTGMRSEGAAISAMDADPRYPARYHRLGKYIIESKKRFGEKDVAQLLRQEGIDSTSAWRAEQIATLYSFDQAIAFPSLRAILRTLPPRQPREPKTKPKGGGNRQATAPQESLEAAPVATTENIVDRFVRLGIEVRETLGNDALDQAVEQIKAHVPETFEEAFVEV